MVKDFLYFGPCVWISGGQTLITTFTNHMLPFRGADNCLIIFKGLKNIIQGEGYFLGCM